MTAVRRVDFRRQTPMVTGEISKDTLKERQPRKPKRNKKYVIAIADKDLAQEVLLRVRVGVATYVC